MDMSNYTIDQADQQRPRLQFTDLADLLKRPVTVREMQDSRRSWYREGWLGCVEDLAPFLKQDVYDAAWDFWKTVLRRWRDAPEPHEVHPPDFPWRRARGKAGRKRTIGLRLRFTILERDHFRCRLCGVAASDGPDVRLEVDHWQPESLGGPTTPENLWTLCFPCNSGKGARLLP